MNNFNAVMQGFNFGVNAVRQYQDAKLEADAGDAYKNTKPTTATDSNFGKVEQDGLYQGPGNDGVMTNAEAASYGLMQPQSTKTSYTLGGKTQDTQFSDNQIEAARNRASADVYANAGRMREASGLRRDAAQLGLTELQMQAAQRENDQGVAADAKFAALPKVGDYADTSGKRVDLAARQAAFENDGMSPAEAQAAATSGLRKVTMADQFNNSASVYAEMGHKYLPQYTAAIQSAATERANQVRRDINKATTIEGLNEAYGHINDGQSIRQVPQLGADGKPTGKFQVEAFDQASGKGVGLVQAGKVYDNLDQFKADANVMANENPDAFVAHEHQQATLKMEQAKIAETARHNVADEGTAARNAGTAASRVAIEGLNGASQRAVHDAQALDLKDKTDARKALEKDYETVGAMTPAQLASPEGVALQKTIRIRQNKMRAGAEKTGSVQEFKPGSGITGGTITTKREDGSIRINSQDMNGDMKPPIEIDANGYVVDANGKTRPITQDEFNRLPSGTVFDAPDGTKRTKP